MPSLRNLGLSVVQCLLATLAGTVRSVHVKTGILSASCQTVKGQGMAGKRLLNGDPLDLPSRDSHRWDSG
jgi:hypothetical protein